MASHLQVGLIGAGRIARCHLASLVAMTTRVKVVHISDPWEQGLNELKDQYGIPRASTDWNDLMADDEVQAVLICSPTALHADQIMAAARAGKKIFCEKPVSLDISIVEEVARVIDENNAFCMVAFQRRFDTNFMRIKQAVDDGSVGALKMIHIVSRDPSPPPLAYVAQSGGLHMDMAIHDFDMAMWVAGSPIVEVMVMGGCTVDDKIAEAGDIDTSVVMGKCANGCIVTIDNCRQTTYGYDQRFEAFGSNGMVSTDNRSANQCTVTGAGGVTRDLPMSFFMDRYAEAYKAEMEAFVDCCLGGKPAPCGVPEGRLATLVAMAAQASFKSGAPAKVEGL